MKALLLTLSLLISVSGYAADALPVCMAKKQILDVNNDQVLAWKAENRRGFLSRALIKGIIVSIIENRQGHIHFEVDFDKDLSTTTDRVEVIYNIEFGDIPDFRIGDELVACGDYQTDPWSPMGAVVHWLHINPKRNNPHEHGFLAINGQVTGLTDSSKK